MPCRFQVSENWNIPPDDFLIEKGSGGSTIFHLLLVGCTVLSHVVQYNPIYSYPHGVPMAMYVLKGGE